MFKKPVLQGLVSRIATCTLKKQFVFRVVISYILDLFIVISPRQLSQALRVEPATVREELGTVLLGQLCAERVDGDDESAAVCFKLQGQCIGEERGKMRETTLVSWQSSP